MSLHPTPSRLALLQAISDGDVQREYPILPDPEVDVWLGAGRRTVTARVAELEREGWVKLGQPLHPHHKATRPWLVTPAGRMILAGGGAR
jgi:hypothetical protein